MCAIECVRPGTIEPDAAGAKAFIAEAAERKVILMGAGAFGNCVRFIPALNIADAEMDLALSLFDECRRRCTPESAPQGETVRPETGGPETPR